MKVTSIEFWSLPELPYIGDPPYLFPKKHLSVSLDNADHTHKYILRAVTGLDVEEIINQYYGNTTNSSRWYGGASGPLERYYNLMMLSRTVSFAFKLNPRIEENETVSDLRDAVYRMIAVDRTGDIQIRFMDGNNFVAYLDGYISRVESDLLSREPEVQITINCKYPLLRGPDMIEPEVGNDVLDFEDNLSTAPHGLVLTFQFLEDLPYGNYTISGQQGTNISDFQIDYEFTEGDRVILNSNPENRRLQVSNIHDPGSFLSPTHLFDKIVPGSVWPIVFPGKNRIKMGRDVVPVAVDVLEFNHYPHYWGV